MSVIRPGPGAGQWVLGSGAPLSIHMNPTRTGSVIESCVTAQSLSQNKTKTLREWTTVREERDNAIVGIGLAGGVDASDRRGRSVGGCDMWARSGLAVCALVAFAPIRHTASAGSNDGGPGRADAGAWLAEHCRSTDH